MRQFLLSLLTAVATASLTATFIILDDKWFRHPDSAKQQQTAPSQTAPKDDVTEQLATLTQQVHGIQKRLSSINEELELIYSDLDKIGPLEDAVGLLAEGKKPKQNKQPDKKQEKQAKNTVVERPNTRRVYLAQQFKKEDRDPKWGTKAMITLMESINADLLGDSELAMLDCRSTFCLVKVNHPNKRRGERFIKRFANQLDWIESRIEVFFTGNDKTTTELYVYRSDKF